MFRARTAEDHALFFLLSQGGSRESHFLDREEQAIPRSEARALKTLIDRCRQGGDEEAFAALVGKYEAAVRAAVNGRGLPRILADELVQETFVRAWIGLPKLREAERFYAWLMGIARHVVRESQRKDTRMEALPAVDERQLRSKENEPPGDPELDEALRRIPEHYREVVVLRFHSELSCEEIALTLGRPLGTITKMLSRAYELLRRELGASERRPRDPNLESCS